MYKIACHFISSLEGKQYGIVRKKRCHPEDKKQCLQSMINYVSILIDKSFQYNIIKRCEDTCVFVCYIKKESSEQPCAAVFDDLFNSIYESNADNVFIYIHYGETI
jgi:hypothetical protein